MSAIYEALDALAPLAARVKIEPCYWIHTPDGEHCGAGGYEWCFDCATPVMRHLRKRARGRDRDYFNLGGGYRTEHDGPRFCSHCGVRLDGSLTAYGAQEEMAHFMHYGVSPGCSWEAHELSEVLTTLTWCEDATGMAEDALACVEALLWSAT